MCTELLFPLFNLHCLHASLSSETAEMSVFPKVKYTGHSTHKPTIVLCIWLQVLDAGRIQEYDEPYVLLQNQDGLFYQMVQQTGRAEAASLLHAAKQVATSDLSLNKRTAWHTNPRLSLLTPDFIAHLQNDTAKQQEMCITLTAQRHLITILI